MINHMANSRIFQFRKCAAADLDAIMGLQETVCRTIKNKDIFVPTERCENEKILREPSFIIGCFDGPNLIAYCSLSLPGEDIENLGWDLLWPRQKVLSCAKLDTIVVHPDYRGQHLQQRIMQYMFVIVEDNHDIKYVLTTVSPENKYSLHNVQAMGFEVLMKKLKYGGKERLILCRVL
jgi:hypothetical protein